MEADFWHERWRENKLAFHQPKPNALLVAHLDALGLNAGDVVFVPLCGKTLDIPWLLSQGLRVSGAELSEIAVRDLFDGMSVTPEIETIGNLKRYSAEGVEIYAGDVFELTAEVLGKVDAVFDRAALVALPEKMRAGYAAHVAEITSRAPQLLITFDYDQAVMDGPPFSVTGDMVEALYSQVFSIRLLAGVEVEGKLKGIAEAIEEIRLLRAAT